MDINSLFVIRNDITSLKNFYGNSFFKKFNNKSMEIAKKYNMKPKKITFAGFIR